MAKGVRRRRPVVLYEGSEEEQKSRGPSPAESLHQCVSLRKPASALLGPLFLFEEMACARLPPALTFSEFQVFPESNMLSGVRLTGLQSRSQHFLGGPTRCSRPPSLHL